ncbi:S-adenosyl-L-methionine-dependent methyltransferase [Stipitochalara longipes BDJ]|nr:S-adenosyl-L-methionine-dependent methyltransferase [Stipitochalara longipes BDJ]
MDDNSKQGNLDADRPAADLQAAPPPPAVAAGPLPNLIPGATSLQPEQEEFEHSDGDGDEYGDGDGDSAYGQSLHYSDTASITSAITKYRYENGRRYHAYRDGAYWAPNDEIHNDQQDMAHHLWLLTLDNKLYLAPILNPQTILDVGTGTGIWAIDIADAFPSAIVRGIDLSPIQPGWVPPNCIFEVDDVTLPWTFPPESFDFIHIREMFGSIGDWDKLFREAYQALKPGAFLECAEHSVTPVSDDGTVGPDHVFTRYGTIMNELARKRGKEFDVWVTVKDRMKRAGFVDVVETRTKWPMNGWSSDPKMRELGRWNQLRITQGIEGFAMRMLTTSGGWSPLEVQILASQIKTALKDRSVHGYLDATVVFGRRPHPSEGEL